MTPTISDPSLFLRVYSNRSDMSRKCVIGSESGGGGNIRTVSWDPVALKRLYRLVLSPTTVNLTHFLYKSPLPALQRYCGVMLLIILLL